MRLRFKPSASIPQTPTRRVAHFGQAAVACWMLATTGAMAWGTGHRYQGELLMDLLPPEITGFLEPVRHALLVNTKYPDQRGDYAQNPPEPAGFGDDWKEQLAGDYEVLQFIRNPNTRGGWHKPYCGLRLDTSGNASIQAWTTLERNGERIVIAGAWTQEDGRARHVFLPEYLIAPFLLTEEASLDHPAEPQLDAIGKRVIRTALSTLAPELLPGRNPVPDAR